MVTKFSKIVKCHKPAFALPREAGLKVLYRKSQHGEKARATDDFFLTVCEAVGRPMLRGLNREDMRARLMRPDCGKWDCPHCGQKNMARLRHLIAFGVIAVGRIQDVQFVTLTSHEKLTDSATTFTVLSKAWNKLNRRFKRAAGLTGHTVYYVQIPEQHKDGRWHLHMLSSPPMPLKWWKDNARACGFGYQAAVRAFDQHGRAGLYMVKYVRKSLMDKDSGWQKSMRRVRHSNNWPISEQMRKADEKWQWDILPKTITLREEIDHLIACGFHVTAADSAYS